MRRTVVMMAFCLFSGYLSHAQSASKTDKIKQVLTLTNSRKIAIQMMDKIISISQANYPAADTTFWNEFRNEFAGDKFELLLIPIYEKYFSDEDLDALIAFYSSPAGRRIIATMPLLSSECMEVGGRWGKEVSEKMIVRLKEMKYM